MTRSIALIWSGLWALPTLLFGLMFYHDYWRLRDCFSPEMGACFDEREGVAYHDNSFVWIIPTLFCFLMVALGLMAARRPKGSGLPVDDFN